jgi:hypothetical protein
LRRSYIHPESLAAGRTLTHTRNIVIKLQPAMALFFGIRHGLKDAREGRPAYLWTVFTNPAAREYLLHEGWKAMLRVFILGLVMDAIYQYIVLRWFTREKPSSRLSFWLLFLIC